MYGCVDVFDFVDYEWVVVVYFECEYDFWMVVELFV